MKSEADVLNTKEAAELLKAHVETIRRMARRGDIPCFKVGKDWRFFRKALMQWSNQEHTDSHRNNPVKEKYNE